MPIFRYLSVSELKLRSRSAPAIVSTPAGSATSVVVIAAQGDGLQILRSHDRADAAAAGVAPFVADGGEAHYIFAGFADGGDARRRRAELGADRGFGINGTLAAQMFGRADLHF